MADDPHTFTAKQEAAAAAWMARRDRDLSGSEQDAYIEWLAEDPAHALAIHHLEQVWRLSDRMQECRPAYSSRPNLDLLAPPRRKPRWLVITGTLTAMAAAIALVFLLPSEELKTTSGSIAGGPSMLEPATVLTGLSGLQRLEDGSLIEMRSDTIIEVHFTEAERRVQLIRGEASFTVAHDASKPFVVEVGGVTVQALGTAFSVGLDQFDVSVEVTEGSVEVRDSQETQGPDSSNRFVLAAGEKTILRYRRLIPYDKVPGGRSHAAPKD